ncbi:hypothetical protein FEV51_08155 [Qipengyuania marisflavi]|uniref:Cysteine biosynthesis protein n=2 Tax=Qipengyuania marisflavi TaxID=2486356 RepID=A0A5S3P665_9SPHN|nr:hypothetical protein FEV51_08155 [Qipengyuania marisflavi]
MISLPRASALAVGQLSDPAILRVLAKSVAITLAIFGALGWLLALWMNQLLAAGGIADPDGLTPLIAIAGTVIGGWLLFRIVALFVLQFFAEDVVRAVEARHYPGAASTARELSFTVGLSNGLRSLARTLIANLVAAPFAIALLVTGIGTIVLFWAVNAWLLGRELQDMVWLRHRAENEETAPMSGSSRLLMGGVFAALMYVPFVNFLAPVLGAATATHMVHRKRAGMVHA